MGLTDASEASAADAVSVLVTAHAGELHRFLSRLTGGDEHLVQDLLQNVFVSLLSQPSDRLSAVELPWLLTVARSRFVDHVRASAARDRRKCSTVSSLVPIEVLPEGLVMANLEARWMLGLLPEIERWALALVVVDGASVDHVADVLGRSVDATYSLLARARRRLRTIMEVERERS